MDVLLANNRSIHFCMDVLFANNRSIHFCMNVLLANNGHLHFCPLPLTTSLFWVMRSMYCWTMAFTSCSICF